MKNEINYKSVIANGAGATAKSLDELLLAGYYLLELTHGSGKLGLPIDDCTDKHYLVAHLLVSDSGTTNKLQDGRRVGQTLILTKDNSIATRVYTRTAVISAVGATWNNWSEIGAISGSEIQDGTVTTEKLSSELREKVDNPLRHLFLSAGAEYNDSGTDKIKKAPWGESVIHKADHYYLNGLGDITEEQMMEIYEMKDTLSNIRSSEDNQRWFQNSVCPCRTLFPIRYSNRRIEYNFFKNAFYAFTGSLMEILWWTTFNEFYNYGAYLSSCSFAERMFANMPNLRCIDTLNVINGISNSAFLNCPKLTHFRIKNLKNDIMFSDSALVDKQSVIFTIQNSATTSAITITLHPDAYTRLANDSEIVAALQAQPLVSLVSA